MNTLISPIGTTDPIRDFHDGAMLHIARIKRPERIVLLYSSEMEAKHDAVVKAINSIDENYRPEIINDPEIIPSDVVASFDGMYGYIRKKIVEYNDGKILVNISSGTPQMKAAFFAIVQINEIDIEAYQVFTPRKKANLDMSHEKSEDIDELIEMNEDNSLTPSTDKHRLVSVTSDNFYNNLRERNFVELINVYEFQGALNMLDDSDMFLDKHHSVKKMLSEIIDAIKFQKLLPEIEKQSINYTEKKLLNAFIIIDIQSERELVSEVLIRVKNFAETAAIEFIKRTQSNLIYKDKGKYYFKNNDTNKKIIDEINQSYINENDNGINFKYDLTYHTLRHIVQVIATDSEFAVHFNVLNDGIKERNTIAHSLDEINSLNVNLPNLVNSCEHLLFSLNPKLSRWRNYKEVLKQSLLNEI